MSQHPGDEQAIDLQTLELAVQEAAARDGTLLVLDPLGRTLTRIWCLLELWRTAECSTGDIKFRVLSNELDGVELRDVWSSLDVTKAEATLETDRAQILERFEQSTTNASALKDALRNALIASATAQSMQMLQRRGGFGRSDAKLVRDCERAAMMLHYCASDFERAEAIYVHAVEICEGSLGSEDQLTLKMRDHLLNLLRDKGGPVAAQNLQIEGHCDDSEEPESDYEPDSDYSDYEPPNRLTAEDARKLGAKWDIP